jgi:hypothetical protein
MVGQASVGRGARRAPFMDNRNPTFCADRSTLAILPIPRPLPRVWGRGGRIPLSTLGEGVGGRGNGDCFPGFSAG